MAKSKRRKPKARRAAFAYHPNYQGKSYECEGKTVRTKWGTTTPRIFCHRA